MSAGIARTAGLTAPACRRENSCHRDIWFLGAHVAWHLVGYGHDVVGFDRAESST